MRFIWSNLEMAYYLCLLIYISLYTFMAVQIMHIKKLLK